MKETFFATTLINAGVEGADFKTRAVNIRRAAELLDELPTKQVEPEVVALSGEMSKLLSKLGSLVDQLPTGNADMSTFFAFLVDYKGATTQLRQQGQEVRDMQDAFMVHSRKLRTRLRDQYDLVFPALIPRVAIVLTPFMIERGFHVNIQNLSETEAVDVTLTYYDAQGKGGKTQSARIDPAGSVRFNPQDIKWRVEAGETITVEAGEYTHTYDTSDLIPR